MSVQSPASRDESFLVADIGATNARFSLATAAGLVAECVILPTGEFRDMRTLLADAQRRLGGVRPAAACLAIAGPVDGERGCITNGGLVFERAAAATQLGCPLWLVNDFFSLARSLPDLQSLEQLGGSAPVPGAVKAVLGPGSGLGMGMLVPIPGGWQVLPSEGGHADLAPGNPLEAELLAVLQAQYGHVSWESVLSGPGLVRLHGAVCTLWGVEAADVDAAWITAHGVDAAEPVCHQTLEIFCGLLGAAAGNLALTTYALGGVYLGGGILPRLGGFVRTSPLRRRFDERGPMTERIREVPLYLIRDPAPGLLGALACLADHHPN